MHSLKSTRSALRNVAGARAARVLPTRHTRLSSTMHDNDPQVLETEKARNLSGTQHRTSTPHKHAPGWNEHLASTSEASVKADKATGSVDDLQRTTIDYIQTRHSPDEAYYSADVVSGPLSAAKGDSQECDPQVLVRKTVREETTEILKDATDSEAVVRAERGVLSTE